MKNIQSHINPSITTNDTLPVEPLPIEPLHVETVARRLLLGYLPPVFQFAR